MVGGYVIVPLEFSTRNEMSAAFRAGSVTEVAGISEKITGAIKSKKPVIIQAHEKEFGTSSNFPVTLLSYGENTANFGGVFVGKGGGIAVAIMEVSNDTITIVAM